MEKRIIRKLQSRFTQCCGESFYFTSIVRGIMEKSKISKIQSMLLTLTLMVTAFWVSPTAVTAQEMVKDPSTGEMLEAPRYGGRIVLSEPAQQTHPDGWFGSSYSQTTSLVLEKLGMGNWALDRDVFDWTYQFTDMEFIKPHLAESWKISPDGLTYTFNIRKGVHWQNKAPMNGRELTAYDVEHHFHRFYGLGSGFTEPTPHDAMVKSLPVVSITATDKWTVVFKLSQPNLSALEEITYKSYGTGWIQPPEVIKQYGDMKDWRNVVGTGPYMLTDQVRDSSITYTNNPDYFAFDEKYPENRLPYADVIKFLVIPDLQTQLAALRTGKIAALTQGLTIPQWESMQRTNPELRMKPLLDKPMHGYALHMRDPESPFTDIRVRIAMQKAIDRETINRTWAKGLGDPTPYGLMGPSMIGYFTPFEEWPEEVKEMWRYDPAEAERLLDEAGFPRGADGIRFKTDVYFNEWYGYMDLDLTQIVKTYWAAIGVDVGIKMLDRPALRAAQTGRTYKHIILCNRATGYTSAIYWQAHSESEWNAPGLNDPEYDAMVDVANAATTVEEFKRLVKEINMYLLKQKVCVMVDRLPVFNVWQPWLAGYNGEIRLGSDLGRAAFARVWVNQELKKEMGH